MEYKDIIIPLLTTFIITAIIGFERQNIGKSAGITAHVFLAIASCSLALLQKQMYLDAINTYKEGIPVAIENQRIIAQIIAGIGFLGAGIIMKEKNHVSGLTTATTLWSSAIVGIILGSGYYLLGITLGAAIILFLYLRDAIRRVNPFKKHIPHGEKEDLDN